VVGTGLATEVYKMITFVDLRTEYESLKDELTPVIRNVFEKANFILGDNVKSFEQEFASYINSRFAVGVASGTEALQLALTAYDIGEGHEVITVPNTAVPTALAISSAGAKVVFVDVDPVTLTMDPGKLESAITSATRAIIPVHLFGQTADMDPILEIARRHQLRVIEDACQAHGAEYKGMKAGSMGDAGCFSFYPTKNLGAYGDGGLVITNDETLHQQLHLLRNLGQTDRYNHKIKGYNSRLDEMQAALLRVKLKHLDHWNNQRRALAALYEQELRRSPIGIPQEVSYSKHVYHLYVVRTPERDLLKSFLDQRNIQTLIHYPVPIHLQEAYRDLGLKMGSFPESERVAQKILSLPMHPYLKEESIIKISQTICEFFGSR
jgi:dTDP-4-amino-4,6-dideoxygalactose transaminase